MAKMTQKKRQNLRRIRRFIKSAEKRGFQFSQELKEKLSTFSTQKLKALKPEKLYKQATYNVGGEIVSGEKGRKIERTISAKKAVETKRRLKEARQQREWERTHRDYIESISISDYEDYYPSYSTIILNEIRTLIQNYASQKSEVRGDIANYLLEILDVQIRKYGEEVIAKSCEQAPDEIKALVVSIILDSNTERRQNKVTEFILLLTGEIPTVDDSKQYTELAEELEVY